MDDAFARAQVAAIDVDVEKNCDRHSSFVWNSSNLQLFGLLLSVVRNVISAHAFCCAPQAKIFGKFGPEFEI